MAWEFSENKISQKLQNELPQYTPAWAVRAASRGPPQYISTTQAARKLRIHLKFLTNDFLTNERLSLDQPHLSPACVLCQAPLDSTEHVLLLCRATSDIRSRLLPELLNAIAMVQPVCRILAADPPPHILTQFLLDCSSINLPEPYRIPAHNPRIS